MNNEIARRSGEQRSLARHDDFITPFSLVDRFFDDAMWEPLGLMPPRFLGSRGFGRVSASFPKVDVEETEKEIKVTANVPGIDPKQINVEVGDDYLSLSGKIEKEEKEEKQGKVYRHEREYGEFRREFSLPTRVNKNGIVAKSKNGVLTITLPKSDEEIKKRVAIDIES